MNPMQPSNLLVVHNDPIVCAGVIAALRGHVVYNIVEQPAEAAQVDVVVADYASSLQLARQEIRLSRGLQRDTKILVLTPNDREADIRRAIEAGVFGYVLIGGPLNELIDGVSALAKGLRYMSPSVAHRMAESLTHATLSPRELEVLRLVADGEANKVIARELAIELGTVKAHVSAIMAKLGARSRTQAASIAASRGLVNDLQTAVRIPPIIRTAQDYQLRLS